MVDLSYREAMAIATQREIDSRYPCVAGHAFTWRAEDPDEMHPPAGTKCERCSYRWEA